MFWSFLLLGVLVAAIVWIVRGRRRAPRPAGFEPAPMATEWGRQPPPQAPQPGMGGQVMGGLATGLAIGAGAIAAQEIGRRMMGEQGHQGVGALDAQHHAGGTATDSPLAHDAGLGSVGIDDTPSWEDASSGGDDGGGGGGWDS